MSNTIQPWLKEAVGGVGGVGGLMNEGNPTDPGCNATLAGRVGAYCWRDGVFLGFTPFALVLLFFWTVPMGVAAVVLSREIQTWNDGFQRESHESGSFAGSSNKQFLLQHDDAATAGAEAHGGGGTAAAAAAAADDDKQVRHFLVIWAALSVLWFAVPAASFLSDSFYQTDWAHIVLGIALSAAYPLSWHLALVSIPVGFSVAGDGAIAPMLLVQGRKRAGGKQRSRHSISSSSSLSRSRGVIARCHKAVGWCMAAWAGIHGGGELLYMLAVKNPSFGLSAMFRLTTPADGENVLFVMGATTLSLLALHTAVAAARRWLFVAKERQQQQQQQRINTTAATAGSMHSSSSSSTACGVNSYADNATFRRVHRSIAAVLLLAAACHWWPFAFFLIPTTAIHATARAVADDGDRGGGSDGNDVNPRGSAKALAGAMAANVCAVAIVWVGRQRFMRHPDADLYTPFVFPPVATLAGFIAAWAVARVVLYNMHDNTTTAAAVDEGGRRSSS